MAILERLIDSRNSEVLLVMEKNPETVDNLERGTKVLTAKNLSSRDLDPVPKSALALSFFAF